MMQRIVLDTNGLLICLASSSPYHNVWTSFLQGYYVLCVTNEIILEYEEILTRKTNREVASNVVQAILNRCNVLQIDAHIKYRMIEADPDDNKFVDCAITANARYIVTEDCHYDVLKGIDYPRLEIVRLAEFSEILKV